ncbi:hypothetical protein [Litoreibacter arenae]|uniref:Uncharacterized protein n=1 Tax=Litoreibacter arenae DSM 19593 TaxID=1123360 RepID=S9QFC6_9RHOB|nr:hypothetical protein [Litoreibacter arenae]EPX80101.1 hypothetical protein thalar_01438 [Litoreibacter arenae DSM 19593]
MKLLHVVTAAAVALGAPALVDGSGIPALDEYGVAHAGKGNGNGGGNGGGNGKGGGGNGGGGNGGGKASKSDGKADKASARAAGRQSKAVSRGGTRKSAARGGGQLKTKFNNALTKLGLKKKKTRVSSGVRTAPKKTVKPTRQVQKARAPQVARPVAAPREKNLHAQLKGLNSLNRNANGFFNGNDPKLETLRAYVASSAAFAGLESVVSLAQSDLADSQAVLDDVVAELELSSDDLTEQRSELESLQEVLLADEPELDDPARSDWEAELATVESGLDAVAEVDAASEAVASAEEALEEAEDDVSENALRDAIAASMNSTGNGTVAGDDLSDEVVDFVSDKLGIGDTVGFINVAVEKAEAEEELAEESDGSAGDDPAEDELIVTEPL